MSACSHECGGTCCRDFCTPNASPELWGEHYSWSSARIQCGEDTRFDWDIVTICEMLVRIDEPDEAWPRYTCTHLDDATGLCTIYDRRPRMCSDYPSYDGDKSCIWCGFQNPNCQSPASCLAT